MSLTFDLSKVHQADIPMIQHAIDGANKAATDYPETWRFITEGKLIQANIPGSIYEDSPIASIIFREMNQDRHSGTTAALVLHKLTMIVREKIGG